MKRRVLIAEDDPVSGRLLQRALDAAGLEAVLIPNGELALERLQTEAFDGVIADWMLPGLDGPDLVRRIRQRTAQPQFVALMSALNVPMARAHALGSGADEFFPKPLIPAKIREVFMAKLAREQVTGASEHPAARTQAWRALPTSIREVLTETLNLSLELLSEAAAMTGPMLSMAVTLMDVEHSLEFDLIVDTPRPVAAQLTQALVGEPLEDDAGLLEVLGELVNIAGGRVKASFGVDRFMLTLGLPHERDASTSYVCSHLVSLRSSTGPFNMTLGVKGRAVSVRKALALREGMVLAENIYGDAGGLLLPIGSRLTATTARRLHELGDRELRVLEA